MTEDIYRSQFRLPYPLYEQLKASADENRRSVNAELVARLEESFEPRRIHDADPIHLSAGGKEVLLTPAKLLAAAGQHMERLAFSSSQLEAAHARLADLEHKQKTNSLLKVMATGSERDEIDLQQMQIMSEVASLKTQAYMLEREIRAAESALGFKALVPGAKGFDPAEE